VLPDDGATATLKVTGWAKVEGLTFDVTVSPTVPFPPPVVGDDALPL
jgi:hypothetical protein